MNVIHFKTQRERLAYIRGDFEEIKPQEVIPQKAEEKPSEEATETSETASAKKPKKTKKGKKKDDKVQAE